MFLHVFLLLAHCCLVFCQVEVWLTTGDETKKLSHEADIVGQPGPASGPATITVDRLTKYQSMKGFGAALSNSAAYMLFNSQQRQQILQDLFGSSGIGLSYVRLVMGASDFNAVTPYTYDDASYEDFNLNEFSIAKDFDFVIPVIQDILRINPQVKIMASPWSAPAWMKATETLNGGELKKGTEYLTTLAEFFVQFVRAYEQQGISIDTLTVQNEPEHSTTGYPTMRLPWDVERDLINILGPRFQQEGITTEIIIWDHNWDAAWYPMNILNDATTRQYVAGSAWHCYAGNRYDPVEVTTAHPDKDIYFTECSGGDWDTNFASVLGWNTQNLFIGQTRIGARTVLLWNLALDENHGPLVGASGCVDCRGVVTVYSSSFDLNVEYYALGQFSKFITPSARRLESTTYESSGLESVAFENTDGSVVVVTLNTDWSNSKSFQVLIDGEYFVMENLPSRSVVTFIKN